MPNNISPKGLVNFLIKRYPKIKAIIPSTIIIIIVADFISWITSEFLVVTTYLFISLL